MALLACPLDPRHRDVHDTFKRHLCDIPGSAGSFAELVQLHWEMARFGKCHLTTKGSTTGLLLEMIVLDALRQWGVPRGFLHGQCKDPGSNAELDIVVSRTLDGAAVSRPRAVGIMLKSSFRERWKQADRDALVFTRNHAWSVVQKDRGLQCLSRADLSVWVLTAQERVQDSYEQATAHARRLGKKFEGVHPLQVLSIYDDERMLRLLDDCMDV